MKSTRIQSGKRLCAILVGGLLLSTSAIAGSVFEKQLSRAKNGDMHEQWRVGYAYQIGQGVRADDEKAVFWYRKAAKQGYSMAQSALGMMYQSGRGVRQSDAQAESWFAKAAASGDPSASALLQSIPKEQYAIYRWGERYANTAVTHDIENAAELRAWVGFSRSGERRLYFGTVQSADSEQRHNNCRNSRSTIWTFNGQAVSMRSFCSGSTMTMTPSRSKGVDHVVSLLNTPSTTIEIDTPQGSFPLTTNGFKTRWHQHKRTVY